MASKAERGKSKGVDRRTTSSSAAKPKELAILYNTQEPNLSSGTEVKGFKKIIEIFPCEAPDCTNADSCKTTVIHYKRIADNQTL